MFTGWVTACLWVCMYLCMYVCVCCAVSLKVVQSRIPNVTSSRKTSPMTKPTLELNDQTVTLSVFCRSLSSPASYSLSYYQPWIRHGDAFICLYLSIYLSIYLCVCLSCFRLSVVIEASVWFTTYSLWNIVGRTGLLHDDGIQTFTHLRLSEQNVQSLYSLSNLLFFCVV